MQVKSHTCPVCHGTGERRAAGNAIGPVEIFRCEFCKGRGHVVLVDETSEAELTKRLELLTAALSASERGLCKLSEAVRAVYYAAWWSPDRPIAEEHGDIWAKLRDAAGLRKGDATKLLGADRTPRPEGRLPGKVVLIIQPIGETLSLTQDYLEIRPTSSVSDRYRIYADVVSFIGQDRTTTILDPGGMTFLNQRARAIVVPRFVNIVVGWDMCKRLIALDRAAGPC